MNVPDFTLDAATSERIDRLAEEGNALYETEGDWQGAIECWRRALALLPVPHVRVDEALWLYASIGDAYLTGGEPDAAFLEFEQAYRCPDGHVNPFVLLRYGQGLRRRRLTDQAAKIFLHAYMIDGTEIFRDSKDDLDFMRSRYPDSIL